MERPLIGHRAGEQANLPLTLKSFAKGASILVLAIGCVVTLGWIFDIPVLKSILPLWVTMKANTAIGFVLCGSALWHLSQSTRRSTRYAQILAAIALGIGFLTLIQYGFDLDLSIDQLLFKEPVTAVATSAPGRMAVNTALNFLLLGSALFLLSRPRSFYPGIQAFTVIAFFISLLGLLGYIYGIQEFYGFGSYTKMAVHTAIAFLILCTGILCLHPDQGIMSMITSQHAGGIMVRRLVLPVLVIPPILSGMILAGYRAQLYSSEVGLSLSAVLNILVFAIAIWINARVLSKIDTQRQQAEVQRQDEARFRSLTTATSQIVWTTSADGRALDDSPSWRAYTGQTFAEYQEWGWLNAVHPDDQEKSAQQWTQSVETKSLYEVEYRLQSAEGHYRYYWVRGVPVLDSDGRIREWIGTCTDIHDRKETEASLQEKTNLLQLILYSISDGIIVADEQGRFLVFNPAAEQIFGSGATDTSEDEWAQQYGLFLPDQVTLFPVEELPLSRAVRGEETKDVELFVRHAQAPDGCWVLVSGRPLRDELGRSQGGVVICRDISDRKQADEALTQSEERYRSLTTATAQIVWTADVEGRVAPNPTWRALTGQTEAEFAGFGWLQAIHPDDRERTSQVWMQAVQTKSSYETEYRIRAADGSYRYFVVRGVPVLNEDNTIREWVGTCTDINDRKQAEDALKQSEERYRSLTTATAQIVWMADVEGRNAPNPTWRALTGQTEAEFADFGWLQAIHPDDRERTSQVWVQAVQTKSSYETEHRIQTADGSYRYFVVRGVPVLNEDNTIREWVGTCTDINDRKQAEDALKQSEERLQAILDNAPAVIYMKDIEGRFITVNRLFESIFKLRKADIVGKQNSDLFEQEVAEIFNENDRKVLEAGTAVQWEEIAPHDDGPHTYISLKFPLLTAEGSPYAICGISTDITDRKQAELALSQAKEVAEAANRAKSEFLANMSHELRTPLNGVIGYAQILQRTNTLNEEDRSRIEVIHQCGSHLLTLINDILDLSKIEARKMALMPTDFHLPAFLQGVAEMCRVRADLKGVQFHYQVASELPIGIRADEKRLRQVLINLLSNAIKFTDTGSVTFTVSFASEGKLRFEIRDTGIGILQEKLQTIFQPFEQVSDSGRQAEGTGLGLAISQEIVGLMESTIQVQSEIGVGSIFWFDVNLSEATEWAKTAHADLHGQIVGIKGRRPKILVVDDRWENRSVVSKLLSPIGFDVAEAATGQEGLIKAVKFQPDLMITDLLMPDIDGFELISRIRESENFKDLIIIVSSASVFEADQYRSIEAGGNDFLPKPVLAAELLQKLQKHLHLEWLYEEQQPISQSVTDDAELIAPPLAELEMLQELAMKGNFKGIIRQVALLEQTDPKYSPFAKRLHQLAKGFQDQEILALIQSYR